MTFLANYKLNVHFLENVSFELLTFISEKAFDKAFQLEDNADPNAGGGGGSGNGEEMTESGQNITTTLIEQSTR